MKTVEEMAREIGMPIYQTSTDPPIPWVDGSVNQLERLVAMARADEREKCVAALRKWASEFDDNDATKRWLSIAATRFENPGMQP